MLVILMTYYEMSMNVRHQIVTVVDDNNFWTLSFPKQ